MSPPSSTHSSVSQVRVAVRARPLSSAEQTRGGKEIVNLSSVNRTVSLGTNETGKCFTFDSVYDSKLSQNDLYNDLSRPLLSSFLEGYNATILAYGQTGSGKTYTMGSEDHHGDDFDPESKGLLPRFMEDIFLSIKTINNQKESTAENDKSVDFTVSASFLEVYGDDVYDLLDESDERKSLQIREDTNGEVAVSGLKAVPVSNVQEAMDVLNQGTMNRTTASTLMNSTSSRSHAVFTISMVKTETSSEESMDMTSSCRMTFVDLAGSERMKKTGAMGERAKEGIKINEGLLALGNVINALADDARLAKGEKIFVPYRASKLTRLLQGALGGNSQTLFLACISPSDTNANETLSTLQYANRARNIKNTLKKNVDPSVIEVQRLRALTNVLQCELVKSVFIPNNNVSIMGDTDVTENQIVSISPHTNSNSSYQDLLLRAEVQKYIQNLHEKAEEKCQEKISTGFKIPQKTTLKGIRKSDDHGYIRSAKSINQDLRKNPRKSDDHSSVGSIKSMDIEISNDVNEELNASLHDLNPDEDMAMLDQLLQLQRKDQEFDQIQQVEIENIEKVEGELKEQESILLHLRENIKTYHNIKEKYDALMMEVSQLEKEKVELEKALNDPTKGCPKTIKKKLGGVESNLERARNEARQHQALCKKLDKEINKCKALEQKIMDLKRGKAQMIRRQKEAATKHKEYTEVKTREINTLKKEGRKTGLRVSKLEKENRRHQTNLERRKKSCDKLTSKLKQTEDRLMNYLKIRKRVLNNRRNGRIDTPKNSEFAPMCDDIRSTKMMMDRSVCNRVKDYQLTESYKTKMTEYSETMELLVNKFKSMQKSKVHQKDISETEQSIQPIEASLERVGSELDNLRERISEKDIQSSLDGEKISKLSGAKARTLLLEFLNDITKSEFHRVNLVHMLKNKDSTIKKLSEGIHDNGQNIEDKTNKARLENEIACLNKKLFEKDNDLIKSNYELDELKRKIEDSEEKTKILEAKKKKNNRVKVTSEDGEEVDMSVFDIDEDELDFEDGDDSDWHPTPAKRRRNRENKSQVNSSVIINNLNDESMVFNCDESHLAGENINHPSLMHLDTLKVKEVKDLLRERELPVYGNKKDLLLRIKKAMYAEEQNKDQPENGFIKKPRTSSTGSSKHDERHISFAELPDIYSPIINHSPHKINKDTQMATKEDKNNILLDLQPSTDFENEAGIPVSEKNDISQETTILACKSNRNSYDKGETNDEVFLQSLRPTIANKKTISVEVKGNENNLDVSMNGVSPSSISESNNIFFQSLRSTSETKRHEEQAASRNIYNKSQFDEKHFTNEVTGSTNKENEDTFVQSLRPSISVKKRSALKVRRKSPNNDENRRDVHSSEVKKRAHVDMKEQNLPHYRRPLESKVFKRKDENNRSITYDDNAKAFLKSLRSTCPQGAPSAKKRKFETSNDVGFKVKKRQILNKTPLNKKIDETEKMLEGL